MAWNTCKHPECENWTYRSDADYCETHRRSNEKQKTDAQKQSEKRAKILEKAKSKAPRKTISKNPKDWSNTFLCSDGTRVTQATINDNLRRHYAVNGKNVVCDGCRKATTGHAHIISQARCKQIGKTELIWHRMNWFYGCNECNAAIENPKGGAWKGLLNIRKCLSFIKEHDPELYAKFQLSSVNQEKPVI
ncbi:MAG TPA: hypothetical protein VFU05_02810 [Cyclobacteriaceae bacterium]|nr:hypothetical protein [Cyclobacteriaceae bacterium]